ncbi:hypothetical protein L1987_64417 [Smallanthus sonchifolius]|uniref:Uncharacterized protein n=1 Tax=Smallanthus sonchifolius TaxID=185202 RepID=A0ACB9CGC7_9ASTR|nr:hypothetical protein L1987_64417 [Smallanthus sonchifolius]
MEEKSGDAGDDQGSGWLQVKKKHRSSSKFSLQGWVGGLSKKQNSNVAIHEASHVHQRTSSVSCSEHISTIKDSSTPDSDNLNNSNNVPAEDKKDVNYLDKCVVSHVDELKTNKDHERIENDNLDVFPKIKWGNLDDDDASIDIKFGDIGNKIIENDPISVELKEKKIVSTIEEHDKAQELEEVKEVSSEDVKVKIVNEEVVTQNDDVSQERVKNLKIENLEASASENLVTCQDSSSLQDSEIMSDEKATSGVQIAPVLNELSGVEMMNNIEGGESKERFRQRLWCFLFENLNRAVDELYLLCELECDKDQMKEAVLVLEEAASDFKELKCRVQEFEKVKKSSDNPPMTMKSEQRRPHALSWEVRRMTTSPHRAEILSSSLEAFKKIQQERAAMNDSSRKTGFTDSYGHSRSGSSVNKHTSRTDRTNGTQEPSTDSRKRSGVGILPKENTSRGKKNPDSGKNKEIEKTGLKKDNLKSMDQSKRSNFVSEREKEKRNNANGTSFRSMDAWKQKRNWEDILTSPYSSSSRFSHSPGMGRKSMERARILHDKLMSPDKKKKTSLDLKKEAEEKHARAMRIRNELENERLQKLQKSTKKLDRVNEWQAVRSTRLREGMHARHQRSETRHEAYLAQVARRAGDESTKVNEVRFITSLNEENKKLMLLQKYQDSELRRAEKLKDMKSKQKEDMAREEAVLERKKLVEAEKMQRLAETQRKKEEALLRREEERKASSAAREAKAMDQMRRREVLAKAQQEEAELLAQKLAERLRESEQRRKFYLEQIRERASMDFRDQSSPLLRRSLKASSGGEDDQQAGGGVAVEGSMLPNLALQHSLKRRIKKIRQRLMALKYELNEPFMGGESGSIGYRAAVGTARAKIGRWLQELQRHRQARKEGAASIGLVTGDIIKFLDGKDPELHASRQAETSLSNSSGNSESASKLLQDVPEDRPLDDLSVLLQANNRLSSEQGSYVLPSNFEEVATGVLKVLNNLALIDINFIQMMLARPDLKMEFFHLMSYLLSHCTSKWGAATDQTGLLLLESLLLLGYFAMFHPENQAVLRWGKSPTILHKVCDLPFVFFSDPELMPVLAATLVAACFGSEQNKGVVQQELSIEMLLSLLRSCKNGLPKPQPDEFTESTQPGLDSRKLHGEASQRSNRRKSSKSGAVGNINRSFKIRNQKDGSKSSKVCESNSESCSNLMLHSRFPASFIDRAELFFSTESPVYVIWSTIGAL